MNEKKNITILTAERFIASPFIDTSLALEVLGVSGDTASGVRDKAVKLYGKDAFCVADGKKIKCSDIESAKMINFSPLPDFDKPRYNAVDAERVIERLMQKPGGCPWDSVQTHESIRGNMIEEAYEAVDAINKSSVPDMIEEFGDVFLQAILQSAIARRDGEFDFDDVCDGLCKKLISRHTFIFGGDSAGSADDALTLWDKNKAKEKNYDSVKNQLQRLPSEFPALMRCQKAYKKIVKSKGRSEDPALALEEAFKRKDYVALIAAAVALLHTDGKDAEVELDKYVRERIEAL